MAKRHQVGFAIYMKDGWDSEEEICRHINIANHGMEYVARAHRMALPIEEVRNIIHRPGAYPDDPIDAVGTVGCKGYVYKMPWYKGWLEMLWARWQLRGLERD